MKILMITTPQRGKTGRKFPLYGLLSVMNYVRKRSGDDVNIELYNIDVHRPDFEKVIADINAFSPDIVGISAVVSTAYSYTKRLAQAVKKTMPDTRVVVGETCVPPRKYCCEELRWMYVSLERVSKCF